MVTDDIIIATYGNGQLIPPPNTPERLRYTYWLHYAEGSAMPPLLLKLIFDRIESGPMPFFVKPIARSIAGRSIAEVVRLTIRDASRFFSDLTLTEADLIVTSEEIQDRLADRQAVIFNELARVLQLQQSAQIGRAHV